MAPALAKAAPKLQKPSLEFDVGRFRVVDLASSKTIGTGRYVVDDKSIRVVFLSVYPSAPPSVKSIVGRTWWLRWSVYRDRLTFSELPGREGAALLPWRIHPFTRIK
jgi:hypothetical protein